MPPTVWIAVSVAIGAILVAYFIGGFVKAKKDDNHEPVQSTGKFESLEDVIDFDGEEQVSVYESSKKKSKEGNE